MDCQTKEIAKTYFLSDKFRIDFTAYAPFHTFKVWTTQGVEAQICMDFQAGTIHWARARARAGLFDTGDPDRNRAMADYMNPDQYPEAAIEMSQCKEFVRMDDTHYRVDVLAVLEFMGEKRQLPLTFTIVQNGDTLDIDLAFKWSFKAYGLKAPRLLFLTVRDVVDIQGRGQFNLGKA